MKKYKHPLQLNNVFIDTQGSKIVFKSTLNFKKKYKFLEIDTLNSKLWAQENTIVFSEQKNRLNKFNRKFN